MKNQSISILWTLALAFVLCISCSRESNQDAVNTNASSVVATGQSAVVDSDSKPNVVQIAIGSADHSTLVAALKAAEYVDALTNVGPFTVFAPVNSAFDALPSGTLDNLVKPENKRMLRDILEYHVLLGVYREADFVGGRRLGTADGRSIEITKGAAGEVLINGAKILGTVEASNGIIHIIDKVLLPE
jgi:uncharacterized surface protein with fasciclin (FAS1) repeats